MKLSRENLLLPRAIEDNLEIVAIGDIHGRADLFEALLDAAAATPAEAPRRLVLLGDLIDRGPDSLGALSLAAEAGEGIGAFETVALMGNHEILMRLSLDPSITERVALPALETWMGNGGDMVAVEILGHDRPWGDERQLLAALRLNTPSEATGWLDRLVPNHRSGGVLFVHGGVNPHMKLETCLEQPWDTPLDHLDTQVHWAWVRGPFLDHKPDARGFSGYFVVHGHTPMDRGHTRGPAEQVKRFRLNIDGGSAMTGRAKMAILRGRVAEVVTAEG